MAFVAPSLCAGCRRLYLPSACSRLSRGMVPGNPLAGWLSEAVLALSLEMEAARPSRFAFWPFLRNTAESLPGGHVGAHGRGPASRK
jgi:hypothetical protein